MFRKTIVDKNGFNIFQLELDNYFLDFVRIGPRLVITFEPAFASLDGLDGSRSAWGLKFLVGEGFSVLGVKPKSTNWYRHPDLHYFLRSKKFREFTSEFSMVTLYGGSMGGYAALAFAEATPGATVIAFSPQSTLSAELVDWEYRFEIGRQQDWSGDFRDGAKSTSSAKAVYVCFDPFSHLDRKHVSRLQKHNLIPLRFPFSGHRTPSALSKLGLLKNVVLSAIDGTMTTQKFKILTKQYRLRPEYYNNMYEASIQKPALQSYCIQRAIVLSLQNDRDKNYCKAIHNFLRFSLRKGDLSAAILAANIIERWPQTPGSVSSFINASRLYLNIGNIEKAARILRNFDRSVLERAIPAHQIEFKKLIKRLNSTIKTQKKL